MNLFSLENYLFKVRSAGQISPKRRLHGRYLSVLVNVYWKGPHFVPLGTIFYPVANVDNKLVLRTS